MIIDGTSFTCQATSGFDAVQDWHDLEARGRAMEACREYLLLVADREIPDDLLAKGGVSDLVQETFLEATRDFEGFEGRTLGDFRGWLRRILLNNLTNFARRYRRTGKRRLSLEVSLDRSGSRHGGLRSGLVDRATTPSNHAIRRERAAALARGLLRLPERYRQVIQWRHQDQLAFEEIGRRLDSSPDAARMVWARAIRRLQEEIEGESASTPRRPAAC